MKRRAAAGGGDCAAAVFILITTFIALSLYQLELDTVLHEVWNSTIWEMTPTRAFSWLKAPTITFTFKTLLRHTTLHCAKLTSNFPKVLSQLYINTNIPARTHAAHCRLFSRSPHSLRHQEHLPLLTQNSLTCTPAPSWMCGWKLLIENVASNCSGGRVYDTWEGRESAKWQGFVRKCSRNLQLQRGLFSPSLCLPRDGIWTMHILPFLHLNRVRNGCGAVTRSTLQ